MTPVATTSDRVSFFTLNIVNGLLLLFASVKTTMSLDVPFSRTYPGALLTWSAVSYVRDKPSLHRHQLEGGTVVQAVVLAYQRHIQDTPFPIAANPFLAPEEGQVRGQVGKENAIVYPENPQVHWAFHGSSVLPSAKLHMYSTPHARANFIGKC